MHNGLIPATVSSPSNCHVSILVRGYSLCQCSLPQCVIEVANTLCVCRSSCYEPYAKLCLLPWLCFCHMAVSSGGVQTVHHWIDPLENGLDSRLVHDTHKRGEECQPSLHGSADLSTPTHHTRLSASGPLISRILIFRRHFYLPWQKWYFPEFPRPWALLFLSEELPRPYLKPLRENGLACKEG